jgi:hypothetical protein
MFLLTWRQHGGSGLGITWGDALELELAERDWLVERMQKQRRREAQEIKKAASSR